MSRALPVLQWRRIGECNQCGECCMSGDPFTGNKGNCQKLTRVDDKYACSDRNGDYYLSGCNVWPSHPKHTAPYPSCSYNFERVS